MIFLGGKSRNFGDVWTSIESRGSSFNRGRYCDNSSAWGIWWEVVPQPGLGGAPQRARVTNTREHVSVEPYCYNRGSSNLDMLRESRTYGMFFSHYARIATDNIVRLGEISDDYIYTYVYTCISYCGYLSIVNASPSTSHSTGPIGSI